MKIELIKEKLSQALFVIEHITKKTTTLPILENVLLDTEKNFLKITATNLETGIIWRILSAVREQGSVAVPGNFLRSVIGFTKEEKIILESSNGNLVIKSNGQKNQIQGANPQDFPIIPQVSQKEPVVLDGDRLNMAISQIVNIPSSSYVKPEISGLFFSFNKNEARVVGTDSFRLAEKVLSLSEKTKANFSFILPANSARILMNILSVKHGSVSTYLDQNQILFEWLGEETDYPNIRFYSRLIEGKYPNYQEVIPKKYTTKLILNKDEFQNQIKRAGLFSGKISEVKISIDIERHKLGIFSESANVGMAEGYIPAKIQEKGEPMDISFNYRFLVEGLSIIGSSEVLLSLSGSEGPATISPVGDSSFIYILMPIKKS